jgi:hypothetical protein
VSVITRSGADGLTKTKAKATTFLPPINIKVIYSLSNHCTQSPLLFFTIKPFLINIATIIKKIELYNTAQECLNEIQRLDEHEAGAVNSPDQLTPFVVEIYIAALKREEVQKLADNSPNKNYKIAQPQFIEAPLNHPNYAKFINNDNTGV